jgi:hypothetical protein
MIHAVAVGADSYIRPQWKPMPNIAGAYADAPLRSLRFIDINDRSIGDEFKSGRSSASIE